MEGERDKGERGSVVRFVGSQEMICGREGQLANPAAALESTGARGRKMHKFLRAMRKSLLGPSQDPELPVQSQEEGPFCAHCPLGSVHRHIRPFFLLVCV